MSRKRTGSDRRGAGLPQEQIAAGAELYSVNCAPCHGARMQDPNAAFNLRKFPPDQHERFVNSVTRGKNQMPPWGDFFKPDQLEALWAYVMAGRALTPRYGSFTLTPEHRSRSGAPA